MMTHSGAGREKPFRFRGGNGNHRVRKKQVVLYLYKEGKVDHITTIDKLGPGKIINFSKEVKDASLHTTMDIRTFAIFFTERGLKELSAEERLAYGKAIKASLTEYFMSQAGFQDRKHFLPSFGASINSKGLVFR